MLKLERVVQKVEMVKKYKKQLYIVLLLAVVALFWFTQERYDGEQLFLDESATSNETIEAKKEEKDEKNVSAILVDVKGAVVHPGVYEVKETGRVKDVIALAGGFTKEADQTKVNLAAKVHDEMVIYVPKVGEEASGSVISDSATFAAANEGKVNINTASVEDLQQLHGIGPAKAEAIIAYREEHGPFQKIEDLLNVTGIGEKSLEKIKDQVVVR
jgi:competence protein ComEA